MKNTCLNLTLNLKRLSISVLFLLVFLSLHQVSFSATGIPRTINFQGKLVNNPVATNVSDTSYTVIFTLYDKASGGTALWTETQTVTTTDGIFRVALGSVTAIPTNFNFNWDGLYLGVKVNADAEMSPRIQMSSVPFAFNSQKVAGLTVQDSTSGAASTSATLKLGDATTAKTFDLGTNNLTFITSGDTTLTFPTSGTVTALGNSTTGTGTTLVLASNPSLAGLTLSSGGISLGGTVSDALHCIVGGVTAAWGNCGTNYWQLNPGVISPFSNNADLLVGGTSTSSAKFGFINNLAGVPTATISGNFSIQVPTGNAPSTAINVLNGGSLAIKIGPVGQGDAALTNAIFIRNNAAPNSNNGNVEIGTVLTPTFRLQIDDAPAGSGLAILNSGNVNNEIDLLKTVSAALVGGKITNSNGYLNLNSQGVNRYITIGPNGSQSVQFQDDGKIGIYTTTPLATLDIRAGITSGGTLSIASVSGSTSFAALTVDNAGVGSLFTASTSGLTRFLISNGGNVAIGTGTPSAGVRLEVGANDSQNEIISVKSKNNAGLELAADTSNQNGEFGNPYVSFSIDGGINTSIIGMTNIANQDPKGNAFSGAIANGLLIAAGSGTNSSLSLGTNGNARWSIRADGTMVTGGGNVPNASFDVRSAIGTLAVASVSGSNPFASLVVDNTLTDIFTASSAGLSRFTIQNDGTLVAGKYAGQNAVILGTQFTGVLAQATTATSGQCLLSGAASAAWGSCPASGGSNFWDITSGVLSPGNLTTDLLVGGISTNSAKFRVTANNLGAGTLVNASVSGSTSFASFVVNNDGVGDLFAASASGAVRFRLDNNGSASQAGSLITLGLFGGASPTIQSTANSSLTLGGSTTGDIQFKPGNSSSSLYLASNGNVGIGNNVPVTPLHVSKSSSGSTVDILTLTNPNTANNTGVNINFMLSNNNSSIVSQITAVRTNAVNSGDTYLSFSTNGSGLNTIAERMRISEQGNIGLGTTSPIAELHVSRTLNTRSGPTGKSLVIFDQTENQDILTASKGGTTKFVIDQNGNLGIGGTLASSSNFISSSNFTVTTAGVAQGLTGLTLSSGAITLGASTGSGQCLTGGATATWGSCAAGSGDGIDRWQVNNGLLSPGNQTLDFGIGGTSSKSARFVVSLGGTTPSASVAGATSFAGLVVDQSGFGDIFTASSTGLTRFTVAASGNVIIGNRADAGYKLDVAGSARIGNNTAGDDISKQTTSDFTQSGYSVTTADSVNSVATANNQVSLVTDLIGAGATTAAPSAGTAVGSNITTGSVAFQRGDKSFFIAIGGAITTKIYDPVRDTYLNGPNMPYSLGAGALAFQRPDGKFVIVAGGGTGYTNLYESANNAALGSGGNMRIGPFLTGPQNTLNNQPAQTVAGAGAQIIRRTDGKVLLILGNSSTGSDLYDPTATSSAAPNNDLGNFTLGPKLTSNVTTGSFVFQRPDGKWIVAPGGTNTTNIYDPAANDTSTPAQGGAFSTGPTWSGVSATTTGAGTHTIQLPDGRYLIFLGGSTATTIIYDPLNNAFSAGPSLASGDTIQVGAHSFQRSDGKWVVAIGGTSKNLQLYDPSANSFSQLTGASGLQNATGAGAGALTFQRPDGMYIVVHGNSTGFTTLFDAGWNTTGTWTSEDLNSTKISTYSAVMWSSNPQSANNNARLDGDTITVSIKRADNQADLTNAPWLILQDSGDLIRAYNTTRWVKIKINFVTPTRSYPGQATGNISQTNVWGGEGNTFLRRTFIQPTLFSIRVVNPLVAYGDPGGAGDPAFGRNFATASATLEGVVTDNSNRLTLQTIRNQPSATPSAGFIIASASADLGTTSGAGAGAHAIERSNGQFIIIPGNNSTQTRVYDPDTGIFTAGPTLPNAAGAGAHSFLMPDGRFFIVLGNSAKNTAIYDPQANQFSTGPTLYGNVGSGANTFQMANGDFMIVNGGASVLTNTLDPYSLSVTAGPNTTASVTSGALNIRRSDGRILEIISTVTNLYDPATNAFVVGPAMTTASATGDSAVQLSNGRLLITRSTTATNLYDPNTNSSSAGPTNGVSIVAGSFMIPRSDGKVLISRGGGFNTTAVFDPQLITGTLPLGPTLPCNINTGGFVLQRLTGEYLVICGGSTNNVFIIDAGWNLGGTYTSEQIYQPNLSSQTGMYWKNAGAGDILVKYRTASSALNLGLASWKLLPTNGSLISLSSGDTWFQTRIDLQGQLQDLPGAKTRVWLASDSGGAVVYYRTVETPVLQYWKLMNALDPNLLTITSNGNNLFRFNADGQAFTSDNGAWNSGGADLAERYTSKQDLQDGEVVTGDRLNPQNVKRSTDPYQDNIMGVVSTQPGFVAGAYTANSYPIALVGRVPVKISTENGPIKSGDYLTSASIPGYAMKATVAGRVLGTAIEDFDPSTAVNCPMTISGTLPTTQCGTVTAFVNLTSYNGENIETLMADKGFTGVGDSGLISDSSSDSVLNGVDSNDKKILDFLKTLKDQNGIEANQGILTGKLSAVKVISSEIVADLITAKTIRADHIEGLEILTNQISSLTNRVGVLSLASQSGQLASNSGQINLSGFNLNSTATASADFNIKGNSLIEGMLMVLKSITVPNLLVSDFASFFGDVIFKKNVTFEGRPTFNSDTAGFATINKGSDIVEVDFDNEYANTPVITASIVLDKAKDAANQKQLEDQVLNGNLSYVITQRTTKGFVIRLSKPANFDINFSWVGISVSNAKTVSTNSNKAKVSLNPSATSSAGFQSILNQLNQNGGGN